MTSLATISKHRLITAAPSKTAVLHRSIETRLLSHNHHQHQVVLFVLKCWSIFTAASENSTQIKWSIQLPARLLIALINSNGYVMRSVGAAALCSVMCRSDTKATTRLHNDLNITLVRLTSNDTVVDQNSNSSNNRHIKSTLLLISTTTCCY